MDPNNTNEPLIPIQYYVVCVIDLLGQRNKLAGWATLPDGNNPSPEFIQALKKTVGTITGFRDAFQNYFDQIQGTHLTLDQERNLNVTQRQQFERFRDCALTSQQFSDTFVFSSPLANRYGDLTIAPVFRVIGAGAMAMLVSLAAKCSLRGAVAIGTGLELSKDNFYGPALARAHHLESEVADWPRIIVDNDLSSFVSRERGYSADPQIDKAMVALAKACRELICSDEDGKLFIDFLGTGMREMSEEDVERTSAAVHMASGFVESELSRFAAVGDSKLEARYKKLYGYIQVRKALWN